MDVALLPAVPERFPVVLIRWLDASFGSNQGWQSVDEYEPPMLTAEAIGYLVFEGKNKWGEDVVTLAAAVTFQEEGLPHFSDSFSLPKGMILEMHTIDIEETTR